jgi:rhamnogalacturonan acetylesterase
VCAGTGSETCKSTFNGQAVTVHTYPYYLTEAGKKIIAKGGKVIMSSQTPNNPWESGKFVYTDGGRFVGYARDVAKALGSNAMFVDHGAYTADIYKSMGKAKTDALFPQDHTHTSPAGADVVSKAFVKGLQCGGGGFLKGFVKNSTESIPGKCL